MRLHSWKTLKMGRFKNPNTTPIWAVKVYDICSFFIVGIFIFYCISLAQSNISVLIALAVALLLLGMLTSLVVYIGLCELFIEEKEEKYFNVTVERLKNNLIDPKQVTK